MESLEIVIHALDLLYYSAWSAYQESLYTQGALGSADLVKECTFGKPRVDLRTHNPRKVPFGVARPLTAVEHQ